jgi:hypothetical protein
MVFLTGIRRSGRKGDTRSLRMAATSSNAHGRYSSWLSTPTSMLCPTGS